MTAGMFSDRQRLKARQENLLGMHPMEMSPPCELFSQQTVFVELCDGGL